MTIAKCFFDAHRKVRAVLREEFDVVILVEMARPSFFSAGRRKEPASRGRHPEKMPRANSVLGVL